MIPKPVVQNVRKPVAASDSPLMLRRLVWPVLFFVAPAIL